jgi:hypothetical protein
MNKVALLACLSACSLVLLFTGCSDDGAENTTPQNTGTNANNQFRVCTLPVYVRIGTTLTPENGSSPVRIVLVDGSTYTLTSQANGDPENGTYTFTPSGDMASLVLTPTGGDINRTINLVINTSTQGTYTSDSFGQGAFTSDGPIVIGGCGPY